VIKERGFIAFSIMAPNDNLTAVLHGINDMRLEQRPIPVPKANQVLLRMEVVGICGSDVHYLVSGRIGPFVVKGPMVIGHEASGTVLEVGKDVKNLKPGDRVAIEPGITCRLCPDCKNGNYHLCRDMIFCATPPVDGNLTRYYVHDADFCHKLPDNMDLEEGALMEPLSVGVHACKRAGVRVGSVVLVLGAGPIGLVSMLTAKAMGASKVIITDLVDHRLKKARELGADFTLRIDKSMTEDDIIKTIKTQLGQDPTVTLECTGAEQCVRVALQVTRSGGVVILVGLGKFEMTVPLAGALVREVNIRGVFRYNNDYPIAIELVKTGKVNVKPLVTHHYTIEDTLKAFNTAKTGEGNPIKVLIHANPDWKP
jgi:L-iditol 2-dehydrogenase